ncbi:MAG: hypothetical protein ACRC5C_14310 [Bacilli bacterium]
MLNFLLSFFLLATAPSPATFESLSDVERYFTTHLQTLNESQVANIESRLGITCSGCSLAQRKSNILTHSRTNRLDYLRRAVKELGMNPDGKTADELWAIIRENRQQLMPSVHP